MPQYPIKGLTRPHPADRPRGQPIVPAMSGGLNAFFISVDAAAYRLLLLKAVDSIDLTGY
ncbi:hypothetical protein GCM10009736_46320 [Actinomadura bangladeshensis]